MRMLTDTGLGQRRRTQSRVFQKGPLSSKNIDNFCGLHITDIPPEIVSAWNLKHGDCIRWCYYENAKNIAIVRKREGPKVHHSNIQEKYV